MKAKPIPKFEISIKQPAPEGSIGFLFDSYHKKGLLELPKGIVINANKFKGNEQQDSDRG
jgi:hypothetical protein